MFKSILCLSLLPLFIIISSCGIFKEVDHTGIAPTIPGEKHRIDCVFDSNDPNLGTSTRFESEASYCFNGPPAPNATWEICSDWAIAHQFEMGTADVTVTVAQAGQRRLVNEECDLVEFGAPPPGLGVRTDTLLTPSGATLLQDSSGGMLGDSSLSNLQATISTAKLRVSAKFLKWRHASTSGQGRVFFDANKCTRSGSCPLTLRYFEIKLDDFTIVRPTVFAKDVKVRNARLYSISNYQALMDTRGNFSFHNVKVIVSGEVNGEKIAFLSEQPTTVTGHFAGYKGSFNVAPDKLVLNINEGNENFAIIGSVSMIVNKFHASLKNRSTNRCLRGTSDDSRVTRASIEGCRVNGLPKTWAFEKKDNGYQIKQAYSSACLNLKTSQHNKEGGPVYLVGCSNHQDQRWSIGANGSIRHLASGKCLNVHRGRENKHGGLVTVYSCANTPDQRWAFQ